MSDQPVNLREPGGPQDSVLCPHCRVDLVMSDRQGIEIDYCPKCRGVWLVRGELDKIIERSMGHVAQSTQLQRAAAPPPSGYGQDYRDDRCHGHGSSRGGGHDHGGYGNHRRKSWLSEIFD